MSTEVVAAPPVVATPPAAAPAAAATQAELPLATKPAVAGALAAEPAAAPVKDAAAATPPPAAQAAPTPLELKYPDGFKGDPEALKSFEPVARELGLDGAKANKLVEFFVKGEAARTAQLEATVAKWVDAVAADPEISGAGSKDYEANIQLARRAVDKFGGKELRAALKELRIDDHPALVRAFVRIGKAIREDSVQGSTGATPVGSDEERFHRALYNNSPSMKFGPS